MTAVACCRGGGLALCKATGVTPSSSKLFFLTLLNSGSQPDFRVKLLGQNHFQQVTKARTVRHGAAKPSTCLACLGFRC
jgi:hypothetical protein